jgi:hypothetical protein
VGPRNERERQPRRAGFRVTARDDEMVRFAGLHMGVEARQLAAWLGMDIDHVWRRAAALVELGLLEQHRVLHARPGIYCATAAGLERGALELPPARVTLAHYEHSVELVWLHIELEREFGIGRVVTERQLRSRELRAAAEAERQRKRHRPHYAVPLRSAARGLHFPDMAVEWAAPNGGLLAAELELTTKSRSRREQIVAAYAAASNVECVRYYAAPEPLRAIERTLEGAYAGELVELYAWSVEAEIAA